MYRAFELQVDEGILYEDKVSEFTAVGHDKITSEKLEIDALLKEVILNGTIDGCALGEKHFPTLRRDVFLSYSHNDQDLAYMVAGILNTCFGLTVFIDSMFWGSADTLLRQIDDEYCQQKDSSTYSYRKRNFSTSHVHAMLTSSIMKAMDQAEIIIFLNTPNSNPNLAEVIDNGGYNEYTLSPWIYEEILLTNMLRETDWQVYRKGWRLDESALEHYDKILKIAYKLPKEKLIPLTFDDIVEWYKKYTEQMESGNEYCNGLLLGSGEHERHPLNILYELKCGFETS